MPGAFSFKHVTPRNRLIGENPKIGIRPAIDGRLGGVRESLEKQTMRMAKSVVQLLTGKMRHADGTKVECVIADRTIGGV
ncbi:MAG TPA: L-fucose isomerase, partial [Verrucomicrobiae bacterium]|nr:L-fucose isomerase [Verrucomicrobiae bacterium]